MLKLLKVLHLISNKKYQLKKQIKYIKKSKMFDSDWYLKTHPLLALLKLIGESEPIPKRITTKDRL